MARAFFPLLGVEVKSMGGLWHGVPHLSLPSLVTELKRFSVEEPGAVATK